MAATIGEPTTGRSAGGTNEGGCWSACAAGPEVVVVAVVLERSEPKGATAPTDFRLGTFLSSLFFLADQEVFSLLKAENLSLVGAQRQELLVT